MSKKIRQRGSYRASHLMLVEGVLGPPETDNYKYYTLSY